jgi:hypothetical protein
MVLSYGDDLPLVYAKKIALKQAVINKSLLEVPPVSRASNREATTTFQTESSKILVRLQSVMRCLQCASYSASNRNTLPCHGCRVLTPANPKLRQCASW